MERIITTIALLVFVISLSFAQSDDIQIVDHSSRHAHVNSMKAYKGGVLYSTQNDLFPLTRLNYINEEGELTQLFESFFEHRFVKYYPQADGTMHIYMCGLFDYDLAIGSIYKFIFDGEDLEFIDLKFWYYFDYITEIEVLEDESIFYIMNNDIIQIDQNGTVLDTVLSSQDGIYYDRLFQDGNGQVYLWDKKQITRLLGDDQTETVYEIVNDSDEIKDISLTDEGLILVVTKHFCSYMDDQFNELNIIYYPKGYEYKYGIETTEQTTFHIQLHDEFEEPSLWNNLVVNDQLVQKLDRQALDMEITEIEFIDEDLILGGFFESVKPTGIIKSFPNYENGQYDLINISLDHFEFNHISKDTSFTYTNSDGELVVVYHHNYEYGFTVSNIGDQNIDQFDVYSTNFIGGFENKFFFFQKVVDGLQVGETKTYDGTFESGFALSLGENAYTFYIPGANYLRDSDMSNNSVQVTIVSEVEESLLHATRIMVYPNPTDQFINMVSISPEVLNYRIVDMSGSLFDRGEFNREKVLDVSDWPTGMYYLILSGGFGYIQTETIVIK